MSWSSPQATSLPSLRPETWTWTLPLPAMTPKKPMKSRVLSSPSLPNTAMQSQHPSTVGTRGSASSLQLANPTGSRHSSKLGQQPPLSAPLKARSPSKSTVLKEVSNHGFQRISPVPHGASQPAQSTASLAHPAIQKTTSSLPSHTSLAGNIVPFFRLTDGELHGLRRRQRRSATHKFSDASIARELHRLGRGWDAYVRAKSRAEEDGRLDEFLRKVQGDSAQAGGRLSPGAVRMETAAAAASRNYRLIREHDGSKRVQQDGVSDMNEAASMRQRMADVEKARGVASPATEFRPGETADPSSEATEGFADGFDQICRIRSDSTEDYQLPESVAKTSEANSKTQTRQRRRPKGSKNKEISPSTLVDKPRPRRVEVMPNYRIPRIREPDPNRPLRPPSPSPRDIYDQVQPQFIQFHCEWASCKAVLNNMTNLRKHVGIVHGHDAHKTLYCRWGKCKTGDRSFPVAFNSIKELDDHVETHHMGSLDWHMGDGRHGQGFVLKYVGVDNPSYLFQGGEQVTPSIKDQKTETLAEWRARKERLKELLLGRDVNI